MWCFILLWLHFVKLGSCLRDCNSHDNWLSCHNIIRIFVKPIWSCPLDYTNFFLFHNVKLLSLTYVLLPMLVHFFSLFPPILPCYICQTLQSHATFSFLCTNFILLNNLYWHIFTIMCLMYDIFILSHVLYFSCILWMSVCIYMYAVLHFFRPS